MVARGLGEGEMGNECLMGVEFQFGKMKKVLEMGCTTVSMYSMPSNCTLRYG